MTARVGLMLALGVGRVEPVASGRRFRGYAATVRSPFAAALASLALAGCYASHEHEGLVDATHVDAHLTDAREVDAAVTTTGFSFAHAQPMCGRDGRGPGWAIVFYENAEVCDSTRVPYVLLQVWSDLERPTPATYVMGDTGEPSAEGIAWRCELGETFCTFVRGTVHVAAFEPGGEASVAFELRSEDGRVLSSPPIPITEWCVGAPRSCS